MRSLGATLGLLVAACVVLAGCGGGAVVGRSDARRAPPSTASAPSFAAASDGDAIHWMHRPPAGSAWQERVRRDVVRTKVTTDRGSAARTEITRREIVFEASAEVLAASPMREVVRYTIARFARTDESHRGDVFRSGVVLEIAREVGRGWVTRAGRPVDSRLVSELSDVVDLGLSPHGDDDDALFGSSVRRRPGDRWPADASAVARIIAQPVERVSASVTFRERRSVDGVPCIVLAYEIAVSNRVVPDVPPEVEVESASLRMAGEVSLPTDESLPSLRSSLVTRDEHVLVNRTTGRRTVVSAEYRTVEERTMRPRTPGVPAGGPAR